MEHDDGAHKCEADHLGVLRAAAAPMQTSSMVRLSMSQLCMTRKNSSKEGCYTDRDKWLQAYRTGRHSRKHTRTHTNTHTHKHTHIHTHTQIHTHTNTYTQIHTNTHTHTHTRAHAHKHTLTRTHRLTNTHACTNTHTHIYTGREKALEATRLRIYGSGLPAHTLSWNGKGKCKGRGKSSIQQEINGGVRGNITTRSLLELFTTFFEIWKMCLR